jgi:methyl-accepting chemotaxis protein
VVAEEVRKLAESAGRSAEQISSLAADISGRAAKVVETMKESVAELGDGREDLNAIIRALADIAKIAATGADKVGVISQAAREQLEGSADMVQAMDHISDVASSNASATEQVRKVTAEQTAAVAQMASAAQELANLSVELQTVVSRFRLG